MKAMTFEDHLSSAAARVADHIADSVPNEDGCKHEFSERFEHNMQEFIDNWGAKKKHPVVRRILLIAAAILLAFGILMAGNSEVRAAVTGWFKDLYYNFTVYKFTGSAVSGTDEDEMPQFELTWIPEGYEFVNKMETSSGWLEAYIKDEKGLIFQYVADSDSSSLYIKTKEYKHEDVWINNVKGDLYISPSKEEGSVIIWQDENTGYLLCIDAFENEKILVKIAEMVK